MSSITRCEDVEALRNAYVLWGLVPARPSVKGVLERRCNAATARGGGTSTRKPVFLSEFDNTIHTKKTGCESL